MSIWLRLLLLFGFLPIGFVFLGAALFFFAWVFAQHFKDR